MTQSVNSREAFEIVCEPSWLLRNLRPMSRGRRILMRTVFQGRNIEVRLTRASTANYLQHHRGSITLQRDQKFVFIS